MLALYKRILCVSYCPKPTIIFKFKVLEYIFIKGQRVSSPARIDYLTLIKTRPRTLDPQHEILH
jgi:hypothetical protein